MSVILYYVIFIFASTAFWAPTVCAFPNLWGLSHHDVHSASMVSEPWTQLPFPPPFSPPDVAQSAHLWRRSAGKCWTTRQSRRWLVDGRRATRLFV